MKGNGEKYRSWQGQSSVDVKTYEDLLIFMRIPGGLPSSPPPPFTLAPITMRKHGAYESGEDRNRRGMKVRDGTTNLSALGLAIFRSSFSCPTVDVWSKWRGKSALRRSLYSCAPRGRIAVCWSDPFKYHSGKGFVRKKNLLLNDRSRVDDFTITWGTHSD